MYKLTRLGNTILVILNRSLVPLRLILLFWFVLVYLSNILSFPFVSRDDIIALPSTELAYLPDVKSETGRFPVVW